MPMALPPQNRTPRMAMLEAIVGAVPRERLMDFPALEPEDHQLIGMFIQQFNYIDFNLRRAIEIFAHAKLLRGEAVTSYPKVHSSKVSITVQEAVKAMDPAVENIDDAIWNLTVIERRCEIRNLLGHWAARRIPNQDSIVLVTKDEADAMGTGGAYLASGHVKRVVTDLGPLRTIVAEDLCRLSCGSPQKLASGGSAMSAIET
jgi:hypothetical protein